MAKTKTKHLHKAKKVKNDEFYTQLVDIENEVWHYRHHFKDKIVLCNCDDPTVSNFFLYFKTNFTFLGLKKLIVTCYKNQNIFIRSANNSHKAVYIEYFGNGVMDVKNLNGNGDFRSPECIKFLEEADIVCTNPPFSLFREYVAQLMQYKKKFLIIGNMPAISCKEIFPLIKNNKMWLGCNYIKSFVTPNGSVQHFGNVTWFTNLTHKKRNEELILCKKYNGNEESYPKYDNYDAINIDKLVDIPMDYDGIMGVPISFLDNYNSNQFEIIASGNGRQNFTPNKDYINPKKVSKTGKISNGNAINCVLAIERNSVPEGVYYTSDNSKYLIAPYTRILIRRKAD